MIKLRTLRFSLVATTLAIIVNLTLSAVTFAQDKRWRGRFRRGTSEGHTFRRRSRPFRRAVVQTFRPPSRAFHPRRGELS